MFMETPDLFPNSVNALQAIVLAGYGNGLYPLTHPSNSPKPLLPVLNKPLLYYALDKLHELNIAGFNK